MSSSGGPLALNAEDLRLALLEEAAALRRRLPDDQLDRAVALVRQLRSIREFDAMARLAEAIGRLAPDRADVRVLFAQALIELSLVTAAADVIDRALEDPNLAEPEWTELIGLRGRAFKEIFLGSDDRATGTAHVALTEAIAAYRSAYERRPEANFWHGVNLLGLVTTADRLQLPRPDDVDAERVAAQLDAALERAGDGYWPLASRAEVAVVQRRWGDAHQHFRSALLARDADAFAVAGTLRQLSQVYEVQETGQAGQGLVETLRAHLATLPGGVLILQADEVKRVNQSAGPSTVQLEAVLGEAGPRTWQWWRGGINAARSVAAVRHAYGRHGSGFLVRGADVVDGLGGEVLLLTNFHVVNRDGLGSGLRPTDATARFEAVDGEPEFRVSEVVWESTIDRHDAALLRLAGPTDGFSTLALDPALPEVVAPESERNPRVYIIGHPGGRELSFSFLDNLVLDHEDRAGGRRTKADVCRVHYRAPTEPGSSGSPVFESERWRVVALHRAGLKEGKSRLNGQPGLYGANEGIATGSIVETARRELVI